MKKVTVVAVIKNRPYEQIVLYLEGLACQSFSHDLIIVDYGSDDIHLRWERELAKKYHFTLIEVTRDVEMFNSGRALNIGIRHVKTPYVITTDADVFLSQDVISSAMKYLETSNCIVFCQRFDTNENGTIGRMHNKSAIGTFIGMKTGWINGIGGIDEHFEGYGGWDNDMKDRAVANGLHVVWIHEVAPVVILHIWHPTREHVKMNQNLMYLKKEKPVIRNTNGWGEL